MVKDTFRTVAATPGNSNWEKLTERRASLYSREDDVRSPFARDYTRILHSLAYRRLKHKTQVFFNIDNDHICTRMEHVAHVESVSNTIAKSLGLNDELTKAIAMGHDLGHAPFGHQGELGKHCVSLVSSGCGDNKELSKNWLSENGPFDVSMLDGIEDIYWRGCLDKYDRFAKQKEWRVCWLPSELNYEAKILHVGSLEDIIDIVPTKDIRRYLLKKYSGYVPGIITNNRRTIAGTESYGAFKGRMRDIDGTGEFVVEIG